jgi:alkanesulfonate monooxygenase SsuD/methylene tetrahydromethanopterin reductase-like flavin-dependent oxidoreductase (luciferase family)
MIAFLRHLIGWIIIIFRSRQDLILENRLGMDGAYFRVHHFAQQLASPFGLPAAVGARTRKIEIGTAVIDMRYENPHYMAEDAGAADLISGGRLLWESAAVPRAGHRWLALFWLPPLAAQQLKKFFSKPPAHICIVLSSRQRLKSLSWSITIDVP